LHDPLDIFLGDRIGDRMISAEEREVLREAYESDEGFRRAVGRWIQIERKIDDDLEKTLPDRELLVLDAMLRRGIALTEGERRRLLDGAESLESASVSIDSFEVIRDRISEDVLAFDACWEREMKPRPSEKRLDRGPMRVHSPSPARWIWRVPLAAVVVVFIAIVVLLARRDGAFEHVATGAGETRMIEFADGTAVHLRENSTFSYVPSERQGLLNRRARLDGRAFFEVSPQQQGLIVSTPTAAVTVVGTVFALVANSDATDLYLVEGQVSFAPEGAPREAVSVGAGQHSRVTRGDRPTTPREVDLADALGWTGFFVFRSTPLADITQRLGRHFGVTIELADHLSREQVTGTFDAQQSVESILETVAAAVGADLFRIGIAEFAIR
jgi:ferric-dicitrate binding protein FerR (iron transport regulator)